MMAAKVDPRIALLKSIDVGNSRVILEPHILFVCGGPVDVKSMANHSVRNMFMNMSAECDAGQVELVLAETFKDWHRGYQDLSDFENDIAELSSLIIVFLESEGALTEFGLFFANSRIRSKLIVVVHEEFHSSESFIKLGLFNPMEREDQKSVRVYEIDHRKIELVDKGEVQEILSDIMVHCKDVRKSEIMRLDDRGHSIFALYQIIDMFLALTKSEISKFAEEIGFELKNKNLESALYILEAFDLIYKKKRSNTYFYYSNPNMGNRVDWKFSGDRKRENIQSIKIKIREHYENSSKEDMSDKKRMGLIKSVFEGDGHEAI